MQTDSKIETDLCCTVAASVTTIHVGVTFGEGVRVPLQFLEGGVCTVLHAILRHRAEKSSRERQGRGSCICHISDEVSGQFSDRKNFVMRASFL